MRDAGRRMCRDNRLAAVIELTVVWGVSMGPMISCGRAAGRWATLVFGSAAARRRKISSCWAASRASAWVRKSVS
jgi:hypothetical protein